ncbi:MAG: tetratricopeptide repeat protein, partial [Planctomycetes bacterium]|nr:tetratricopeptide repeat protein [Planctomycetota bacterium]
RLGDLDRAREGFDRVLALDPTHPTALFNAGWIAERQGNFAQALAAYAAALKSQPTLSLADRAHRALALRLATHPEASQRNGPVAREAMERWVREFGPTAQDLALLAAAQAECGDFPAAIATVDRALTLGERNPGKSAVLRGLESARKRYAMGQPLRLAPNRTPSAQQND